MSNSRAQTLHYAARWSVIAKYLGLLAIMLALLTTVPLAAALLLGDSIAAWRYFVVVAVLLTVGVPLGRLSVPQQIQVNEALTVVLLAFLLGPAAMVWPMQAAGLPWLDAWFEALSGITTTGLSTLGSVEDKPPSFLFARAWMQWYGGLGIVILSVALFLRHGAPTRRLVDPEVTGDTLVSTTQAYARRVLVVYSALTLFGLALVWLTTGNGFEALCHTLSAVSTGGFSTHDDSLDGLPSRAAATTLIGVAWLGAVSLPLYYRIWSGGWQPLARDLELRALLIATLMMFAALYLLADPAVMTGGWLDALLLGATAQTGTGFTSVNVAGLESSTKLLLIASMLIGGSIGSTTGGIKLLRLLLILRLVQLLLQRAAAPRHAVIESRLGGHRLDDEDLARALLLLVLFGALILFSWFIFLLYGHDPMNALFEVVSAAATVGLSTGVAAPDLDPVLKVVLGINMLAGRVEIVALLIVLYPGTWIGKRRESP